MAFTAVTDDSGEPDHISTANADLAAARRYPLRVYPTTQARTQESAHQAPKASAVLRS